MRAFTWTRAILLICGCALIFGIWLVRKHQLETSRTAELRAIVRVIEARMVMPQGADELGAYIRYYDWSELNGRQMVEGHYLRDRAPMSGSLAEPVSGLDGAFLWHGRGLPFVFDGGCYQVTVYFDVEKGELVSRKRQGDTQPQLGLCNGYA